MHTSIIIPTHRVGGLDILFQSLSAQTESDFDLIIVDGLYKYRKDIVTEQSKKFDIEYMHLPPPNDSVEFSNYSGSINLGITRARGDIIVMQCDYSWMSPECIYTHTQFHRTSSFNQRALMLDYICTKLPNLKPGFPKYCPDIKDPNSPFQLSNTAPYENLLNECLHDYETDIISGKLDDFMWSLFDKPLSEHEVINLPRTITHIKDTVFDHNWCSLKNESFKTELLLEYNGLDEDMDGSHLFQDQELSFRMRSRAEQWSSVRGGITYIIDPRPVLYAKRIIHPMSENQNIMNRKLVTGERINPTRDLASERRLYLGLT